jgi:putative hydroxymethylpyrimidine transport system permease protein
MSVLRPIMITAGLIGAWELVVLMTGAPPYILPGPWPVFLSWVDNLDSLILHASITGLEIVLGLLLGAILGVASATVISFYGPARRWLMPVLVISQAMPVFALAPVLVLWLGYGLASKVAMTTMIIYFPVTAAFFDGLRRTEPGWLDLAKSMNASRWAVLRHVRMPAALPALASGLRVATAVAPIGAVVGEWVGSSVGLGYMMLHANGRMQIDLMFAALATLGVLAIALYFAVDVALRFAMPWQSDTLPDDD